MYVSPIKIIMEDIKQSIDTNTMKIIQGYNINVDKDELIKALSYDRDQYNKGYEDAKKDVLSTIDNFISMDEYYHPESEHKYIPITEMKSRVNDLPYENSDEWWEYFNGKDELSKDELEIICIHLNAFKENLCNQGLWSEAEEYQHIIDKIHFIFADMFEEKTNAKEAK